jgi:hypothetical protein
MLNPIFSYIILAILALIVIGFFIWAFSLYSALNACEQGESPLCPLMYCNEPTAECGNYPWRPDPTTGAPICSKYLLTMSAPVGSTSLG